MNVIRLEKTRERGRVFGVIQTSGGVGCSTFAALLSSVLAYYSEEKEKIGLVDLQFGGGIDFLLGAEDNKGWRWGEVLEIGALNSVDVLPKWVTDVEVSKTDKKATTAQIFGRERLKGGAKMSAEDGDLLPSGKLGVAVGAKCEVLVMSNSLEGLQTPPASIIRQVVSQAAKECGKVVLDMPLHFSGDSYGKKLLDTVDEVILVVQPTLLSINSAVLAMKRLNKLNKTARVVVSKSRKTHASFSRKKLSSVLGIAEEDFLGDFLFERDILSAVDEGKGPRLGVKSKNWAVFERCIQNG